LSAQLVQFAAVIAGSPPPLAPPPDTAGTEPSPAEVTQADPVLELTQEMVEPPVIALALNDVQDMGGATPVAAATDAPAAAVDAAAPETPAPAPSAEATPETLVLTQQMQVDGAGSADDALIDDRRRPGIRK